MLHGAPVHPGNCRSRVFRLLLRFSRRLSVIIMPRFVPKHPPSTPFRERVYTRHDSPKKNRFIGAVQALKMQAELAGKQLPSKEVERVGLLYQIPPSTARRLWSKFHTTRSTHSLWTPPAPRKTTEDSEDTICEAARADPWMVLDELGRQVQPPITRITVALLLARQGIHRYHARKVPLLTWKHRRDRLAWATYWAGAEEETWKGIIWSDECYICLDDQKGIIWVSRTKVRRHSVRF
jgi:hypothetical protein